MFPPSLSPFSFWLGTVSPNSHYFLPWNLWIFGQAVSHNFFRYSYQHSHFWSLSPILPTGLFTLQNALLPPRFFFSWTTASVLHYSLPYFRRMMSPLVRCYSFIIGWLLPSPPPNCHRHHTSLCTSCFFETLSFRLGCFPLNLQYFSTAVGLNLFFRSNFLHSLPLISTLWHALSGTLLYLILPETRTALTAFVKNQLSRSLISLSPLFTIHPRSLQRTLVQSSMSCYWHFNLIMNRSLRFGSSTWVFFLVFSSFSISLCLHFPLLKLLPILESRWSIIP